MKAIVATGYGSPEVLHLRELDQIGITYRHVETGHKRGDVVIKVTVDRTNN